MVKNAVAALAIAAGAVSILAFRASDAGSAPEPLQGLVEYEETDVGFEVPGRLSTLVVGRGDRIEKDTVLATLDDALERAAREARGEEARAAQAQAELVAAGSRVEEVRAMAARVRAARATEDSLKRKLDRESDLQRRGVTPPALVEDLAAQYDRARAERQALEQSLSLLMRGARSEEKQSAESRARAAESMVALEDVRLTRHELRAPLTATVLDVHAEPGEVVGAAVPVVTLADTQRPYVEVFVPQARLGSVRLGQRAFVRVDTLEQPLEGAVEHVSRRSEFTPRFLFSERERPNLVFRVRIRIADPAEKLRAGLPAFVTLEGAR